MLHFWAVLFCLSCIGAVPLTEGQVSRKGLHPKRIESRIINGHKATLKQFPWMVAIEITTDNGSFICGGSLIDKQWVLTAAHCLFLNITNVTMSLGTTHYERQPYIKDSSRQELWSNAFYMHEGYDDKLLLNDIALIKLPTPVNFSDNIKLINLTNNTLPSGSKVVASGWGLTQEGEASDELLFANMKTLSNEECKNRILIKSYFGKLCALSEGEPHQSTCEGDSGGPLVYNETGTPFLVGIISNHIKSKTNCDTSIPRVLTDVYTFRDWIKGTIKNNTLSVNLS